MINTLYDLIEDIDTDIYKNPETIKHKKQVEDNLNTIIVDLAKRGEEHDNSKLEDPEATLFYEFTPKLKKCSYGSEDYKEMLKSLKPALDNHYKLNRHHPEHFKEGIKDMNLLDLLEMLADWYASSKRHDDGNIKQSIKINKDRFKYTEELEQILINTLEYLEWN